MSLLHTNPEAEISVNENNLIRQKQYDSLGAENISLDGKNNHQASNANCSISAMQNSNVHVSVSMSKSPVADETARDAFANQSCVFNHKICWTNRVQGGPSPGEPG